jgi:hypothetical protein
MLLAPFPNSGGARREDEAVNRTTIKTFIGTATMPSIGKGFGSIMTTAVEQAEEEANRWLAEHAQDKDVQVQVQTIPGKDVFHLITVIVRTEIPAD